jgi:hypothetical protein
MKLGGYERRSGDKYKCLLVGLVMAMKDD